MDDYIDTYTFIAEHFLKPANDEELEFACSFNDLPNPGEKKHAEDFSWLFDFNIYPYASVFLDYSGKLNAPWTRFVTGMYQALSLSISPDAKVAANDHISLQLAALVVLIQRRKSAKDSQAAERALHAEKSFLLEQVLPWIPSFCDALIRSKQPFFADLAAELVGVVQDHGNDILTSTPIPFNFEHIDSSDTNADTDADEKLFSYCIPARTGMFLCRFDIQRMARELELPVRFAERSFMFKNLLISASDADKVDVFFYRLAEENRRQQQVFREWGQVVPVLQGFWQGFEGRLEQSHHDLKTIAKDYEAN